MAVWSKAAGAWVFVSHSNRDLLPVREVRNFLEERGHNPTLFFLKSVGDADELDDLIEREIHARSWFVLCDSENARASKWVKREREIVQGDGDKHHAEVDIEKPLEPQLERIDRLLRRASVFLSSARSDAEVAQALSAALLAADFGLWQMEPGAEWQRQLHEGIEKAVDTGAFLALVSPAALRSPWVRSEVEYALRLDAAHRGSVVPVAVGGYGAVMDELPPPLRELQFLDWQTEGAEGVIRHLRRRVIE